MTNVEKLQKIGILGDIREYLGAEDENDTQKDHEIENMDNNSIISNWCGWEIGDSFWWRKMKTMFDTLETLDKP